jgi:hypothetical protein
VSPEAEAVARTIDREVGRARLVIAAESAALGAAVAAWSVTWGFLFALAFCVWRSRAASRRSVVRRLERANPHAGNLLVTVEELRAGSLSVKPEIRTRVLRDAGVVLRSSQAHSAVPVRRLILLVAVAAAAWVIVAGRTIRPVRSAAAVRGVGGAGQTAISPVAALHVTVTVEPPSYTGLPSTTTVDPVELRVVENSRIAVDIQSTSSGIFLEINDTKRALAPGPDGRFIDREVIARNGYLLVTADDGARRMVPIAVTPDALPEVRIVRPGRDLVFASGNPRISFDVRATDDYGLRSVSLRFTRVSGSGEQYEFKNGDIPLSLEKTSPRAWKASAAMPLADLGLQEGDMLVYRAVASDVHPGDREASSDAYFIEISKIGAAGDAFTLPEEETRYALSQQMLIIKTERLGQRRSEMDGAAFIEAAQGLAVEQRMIRSEFVFMLGGEIEDEEVEAEQSIELQAGRLANRGQRDLRAATVAMSQAEKQLTDANAKEALEAERAAVAALQRAFARDRYILRALATRSQLDSARRLTGAVSETIGWRRSLVDRPESRRAVELQDLLRGLGEAVARVESPGADQRAQLSILAALAVRADTQSGLLRQAAADLQRLADEWQILAPDRRAQALDAVTALVAQEARRALADAPLTFGGAR